LRNYTNCTELTDDDDLTVCVCVAGPDGILLHCGTDTDRPCELFSSSDLTTLRRRQRLEHDDRLQLITANSLDSVDVCMVVMTTMSRDVTRLVPSHSPPCSSLS